MTRRIFADAAYFIALFLPDDDLADVADTVSKEILRDVIVTTEAVLFEFLSHVSRMGRKLVSLRSTLFVTSRVRGRESS